MKRSTLAFAILPFCVAAISIIRVSKTLTPCQNSTVPK